MPKRILYTLLAVSVIVGILIQLIGNISGAYFTLPLAVYVFLRRINFRHTTYSRTKDILLGGVLGSIALASLPWIDPILFGPNFNSFYAFIGILYLVPIGFCGGVIFAIVVNLLMKKVYT